jgi:hypothetical protein
LVKKGLIDFVRLYLRLWIIQHWYFYFSFLNYITCKLQLINFEIICFVV